jgi:hypothetical protein
VKYVELSRAIELASCNTLVDDALEIESREGVLLEGVTFATLEQALAPGYPAARAAVRAAIAAAGRGV